jgi:N,N'-diacetyllegionaminate synthase
LKSLNFKEVPMRQSCYIIAEAGVNHNGSLEIAKALVDAAADAGADAVKFQTFKADNLVTQAAAKADYQKKTQAPSESQHAMLRRLELSKENHYDLIDHCRLRGIQFLSTAFDSTSAGFLDSLSLPFTKIPSGEITNLPYLRQTARSGCPVILSTGMATLGEVEAALEVLVVEGIARESIVVLQCHTDYPTRFEDANLLAMQTLASAFPGIQVGYSDHTLGIEAPIAAVAMGACLIEKHFTLDRTLPGPDHAASLEPAELKAMVNAIRNIELALGHGRKEPSASELKIKQVVRKSIVASRTIQRGETFSSENLCTKRPGTGISPMRWDEIIGKPANRAYAMDDLIEPQ